MSRQLTQPAAEVPPILVKKRQAASALGVCERFLDELRRRGELVPIVLPGRGKLRSIRYAVADLQHWVERTKDAQHNGQT